MDINDMLCVGRNEMCKQDMNYNQMTSNNSSNGFMGYSSCMTSEELRLDFHEPRILPVTPSRSARRDLSPPTKSILRHRSPSPNHGSPSSFRNVRFCDKDSDNDEECEAMFAKIHVNKTVQTGHHHHHNHNHHGHSDGHTNHQGTGGGNPVQATAKRSRDVSAQQPQKPKSYEIKTSTPRYGPSKAAPAVEFDTMLMNGGGENSLQSFHQRSRSPSNVYGHWKEKQEEQREHPTRSTDGQTQTAAVNGNHDNHHRVNANGQPQQSTKIPVAVKTRRDFNGHEAGPGVVINGERSRDISPIPMVAQSSKPIAVQTTGTIEESRIVRTIEPSTRAKQDRPMPNSRPAQHATTTTGTSTGNSIIRNLELGSRARSVSPVQQERPKLVTSQTQTGLDDIEPQDGNTIIKNMDLNSSLRSVTSTHSDTATQTQPPTLEPSIPPDGSVIIRNLEGHRHTGPKFEQGAHTKATVTSHTQTGLDSSEPPDGNSIIRNLELHHQKAHSIETQTAAETADTSTNTMEVNDAMTSTDDIRSASLKGVDENRSNHRLAKKTVLKSKFMQTHARDRSDSPTDEMNKLTEKMGTCSNPACQALLTISTQTPDISTEPLTKATQCGQTPPPSPDEDVQSIPDYKDAIADISQSSLSSSMSEASDTANHSRSIGIQTPEPQVCDADGSRIIQNMLRPLETKMNNPNWSAFVNDLEQHSSSSSDSESSDSDAPEPVLVYDKHAKVPDAPSNFDVLKPCERLSEHSARSLLAGESVTKQNYRQALSEVTRKSRTTSRGKRRSNDRSEDLSRPQRSATKGHVSTKGSSTERLSTHTTQTPDTFSHPPTLWATGPFIANEDMHGLRSTHRQEHDGTATLDVDEPYPDTASSVSLGFTPIETHSFNPETLKRNSLKQQLHRTTVAKTCTPTSKHAQNVDEASKLIQETGKESLTKNLFIKGLYLGPMPNMRTSSPVHGMTMGVKREEATKHPLRSSNNARTSSRSADRTGIGSTYPDYGSSYSRQQDSRGSSHGRYSQRQRQRSTNDRRCHGDQRSSSLTPSLNQMRNNMMRKSGTNVSSDGLHVTNPFEGLRGHTSRSTSRSPVRSPVRRPSPGSHGSRYDSFVYNTTTNEAALLRRWAEQSKANYRTATTPIYINTSTYGNTNSRRQALSETQHGYMYTEALYDQSNKRPTSREPLPPSTRQSRSAERERHRHSERSVQDSRGDPSLIYDDEDTFRVGNSERSKATRPARRNVHDSTLEADDEVRSLTTGCSSNDEEDPCLSLETSTTMANTKATVATTAAIQQHVKQQRKPPLPKTPTVPSTKPDERTPDDHMSGGITHISVRPPMKKSKKRESECSSDRSNGSKEQALMAVSDDEKGVGTSPTSSEIAEPSQITGITNDKVTIGHGRGDTNVDNSSSSCVFLGHDAIQKIIDEAKL